MAVSIQQEIQEKVPMLGEEQQREVLTLVETLLGQKPHKNIWQKLEERLKQVPPEEMAELPTDASENLDHYLYGSPKKQIRINPR